MHSQILKDCLSPKKLTFPMTKYILTYLTNSKYSNVFYWKAFLVLLVTLRQWVSILIFRFWNVATNAQQMKAQIQTLNVI